MDFKINNLTIIQGYHDAIQDEKDYRAKVEFIRKENRYNSKLFAILAVVCLIIGRVIISIIKGSSGNAAVAFVAVPLSVIAVIAFGGAIFFIVKCVKAVLHYNMAEDPKSLKVLTYTQMLEDSLAREKEYRAKIIEMDNPIMPDKMIGKEEDILLENKKEMYGGSFVDDEHIDIEELMSMKYRK